MDGTVIALLQMALPSPPASSRRQLNYKNSKKKQMPRATAHSAFHPRSPNLASLTALQREARLFFGISFNFCCWWDYSYKPHPTTQTLVRFG